MKRPAHLTGIQQNFNLKPSSSQKQNPKAPTDTIDSDDDFGGLQDNDLLSPPPKAMTKGKTRENDVSSFDTIIKR